MAWTSAVFPVPISPDRPITAGAVISAPSASPNRLSSSAERRIGLELENLVAQHCRQLEVEFFGGGLHLLLQQANERVPLLGVGGPADRGVRRLGGSCVGDPRDEADVAYGLDDGPRGDAVLEVVCDLRSSAPIHLAQGPLHRPGDAIG